MTTRASVIVALWLVLTGSVGDAVLHGGRSPATLLAFHGLVTALAIAGLWLHFRDDPGASAEGSARVDRRPHRYD